jgi:hypothetical protein
VSDDRGSMPMALLLTVVGISFSAVLLPIVTGQMTATRGTGGRARAVLAAEAGVDVALAQIRAATDGAGNGLPERLPACVLTGSLSPDPTQRPPRYRVSVTYRDADGTTMSCPPNDVPTSATLRSTGIDTPDISFDASTAGTRTIDATYWFRTTNANVSGGLIPVTAAGSTTLCMDAGTNNKPASGTRLRMQACQSGASDQRFAYTEELNIKVLGSETTTSPLGMCLDAGTPHATDAYLTFQPCLGRVARQQWSLNDYSNFQGTGNGVALDSYCLNVQSPDVPGSYVVLGGCGGVGTANRRVFLPETAVGAGMAGATTGQVVNFKQFSRCLDVTNTDVTSPYMIVWFCKQAPDGNVTWNQKWSLPTVTAPAVSATGRIRTNGYCLRSPGSTAANRYVTMTACAATGSLPTDLQWTVYRDTGDYTTSYRIVDGYGYCLVPTDLSVSTPDTHTDGTAKAKVTTCGGSPLQKWNAPPYLNKPTPLTDIVEK